MPIDTSTEALDMSSETLLGYPEVSCKHALLHRLQSQGGCFESAVCAWTQSRGAWEKLSILYLQLRAQHVGCAEFNGSQHLVKPCRVNDDSDVLCAESDWGLDSFV